MSRRLIALILILAAATGCHDKQYRRDAARAADYCEPDSCGR